MIHSVARIVTTRADEVPALFEGAYVSDNFVQTFWMTAEPVGAFIKITELESGEWIYFDKHEPITWMQPEDKNSPAVQAELITALASIGIEL